MPPATDPLAALVEMIATAVVEKLRTAPSGPTHYSSNSLPPGVTSRSFLDAITRGELRASKVGRRWVATAADVDVWIASRRTTKTSASTDECVGGWSFKAGAR